MADNVSELVARILEHLGTSAFQEINWICGVKDELGKIKETLLSINAVLLDAQEQQSASKTVKQWLQNLRFVAYDIEDVLDLISTQDLELHVNGRSLFRRISRLFTYYDVAQELRDIRHRLDEIEYCRRNFLPREWANGPLHVEIAVQRETYSYIRESDVIGREEDKQEIISCLLSSSDENFECLPVIPITGIGGMGKTTLAKVVFNDPRVAASFDLRLWVHVSGKFVLRNLIANILQNLTGLHLSHLSMDSLHSKLREKLSGETFLLILDDVWIKDLKDWLELRDLLVVGSPRSKVIVTTREERVASITGTMDAYRLKGLSDHCCWSIFAKYAFGKGEEKAYPLLVEIGKSMVQKCCGVPLAAKTLGSMLRNERGDYTWRQIEDNELWKIEQGPNDVLPALKLSYDHAPNHLKSCFALCAVMKKGLPLFRYDMINMWMALGLLESREGGEDLEDIGDKYFDELVSRSFLQSPDIPVAEKNVSKYVEILGEKCSLHHVFMFRNDFIEYMDIVLETLVGLDEKLMLAEMHDLVHDLAIYVSEEIAVVSSSSQAISKVTRYILWDHEDLSTKGFPLHLFEQSKARVFMLPDPMGYVGKSFLKGLISSLKCLRILNLYHSDFEELPDSIGDLKHLRYLNISFNTMLVVLPRSICKLVNLQTLFLVRCTRLETLPKDLHKLVSLRYLSLTSRFISFPDGCLNGLSSLRVLRLWNCHRLSSLPKGIGSLKNLRILQVFDSGRLASLPNEMKHLANLELLRIYNCANLDLRFWEGLCGLRSLKYLDFSELPKLSGFPYGVESAARCLRYFRVANCKELRALPDGLQHCTSLLKLTLSECPDITALPSYMPAFISLQELTVDGCPEIRRRCLKDVGADWHLISHISKIRVVD